MAMGKLELHYIKFTAAVATRETEVPNEILQLTCHFLNDIMTKVQTHKV